MLEAKNLTKVYRPKRGVPVLALNGVNLSIEEKGMVFILGKSGSGKSTLLNTLGGLDKYDDGEIIIKGKSSKNFSQSEFDSYRNTYVGFIFQEYNILNDFSVGANIALAMELQGKKATPEALNALLETVDLAGFANRKPNELSGGQKQRVAIARALIKDPEIIMADEPTGALDSNTGRQVFETLQKLSKDKLVIIVSHDREFAEYYGDRVIELADGQIISDIKKVKEQSNSINNGVNVINDEIVHIKKGYTLTPADIEMIVSYLNKNRNSDTIISISNKTNENIKKQEKIDDEGNRDTFELTNSNNLDVKAYEPTDFKLIKSKLPLKNAVRIGASSLKVKPFRLVLTILLSAIALVLFGLANTAACYNRIDATTKSILDNKETTIGISKNYYFDGESSYAMGESTISDSDIQRICKDNNLDYIPSYSSYYTDLGYEVVNTSYFDFRDNLYKKESGWLDMYSKENQLFTDSFSSLTVLTSELAEKFGYTITGRLPSNTSFNEIAVTDYIYQCFKHFGYVKSANSTEKVLINSKEDLIGKTLTFNFLGDNLEYEIVGIVDTKMNLEQFKPLNDGSIDESGLQYTILRFVLDDYKTSGVNSTAFVSEGLIETLTPKDTGITNVSYIVNTDNLITVNDFYPRNAYNDSTIGELSKIYLNDKTSFDGGEIGISFSQIFYWLFNNNTPLHSVQSDISQKYFDSLSDSTLNSIYASDSNMQYYFKFNLGTQNPSINQIRDNLYNYLSTNSVWSDYVMTVPESFQPSLYAFFEDSNNLKFIQSKLSNINISLYFNGKTIYQIIEKLSFIYNDKDKVRNDIYLTSAEVNNLASLYKTNNFLSLSCSTLTIKTPTSEQQLNNLVTILLDRQEPKYSFNIKTASSLSLSYFNELIEIFSTAFVYVGIAFAIFAGLMMMNYISLSISHKKREIGILRAIGARSKDVFAIFFSESFIICCINSIISLIGTLICVVSLNSAIKNALKMPITLLQFGVVQVLLVFGIAFASALIASFLPVSRIAKKRPIDAIKDR